MQQGVDRGLYRELAVGWIDGTLTGPGQRQTWYLGQKRKPDADSAFEIGAASEIFTGLLLAQAAIAGKVRMDTAVHELLPRTMTFADPVLGTLTLRQLATRQSGLPAVPPNLFPRDREDLYAGFDEPALLSLLANFQPKAASAAPNYTILDAGLLGEVLGRAYAQRLAVVMVSEVLDPLGMTHSGFGDGAELLAGYGHGRAVPHWHFGALAGAAGLRSTLPDLLRMLQAYLTPEHSPLRAALLLSRQPQGDAAQSVGLGWNTVEVSEDGSSWPLVWRASRTAGFSVFLGFRTDKQQALALLGNTDADLSAVGIAWLQGRSPPAPTAAPPPAPELSALAAFAGLYRAGAVGDVVVRTGASGLSVQFPGNFPFDLHLVGHDVFAADDGALVLSFQRDAGAVNALLLGRDGANVLVPRISRRAPRLERKTIDVDADSLLAYSGDYQLDALALARVAVSGDGLTLQPSARMPMALLAFAQDRFTDADGSCEVHFLRDDRGTVTGMTLVLGGIERRARRVVWRVPALR